MSAERGYCARCGETYHEENLQDCAVCHNDICPRCGQSLKNPATKKSEYICKLCLTGREGWWNIPSEKNGGARK